jgi:hypothetical protein
MTDDTAPDTPPPTEPAPDGLTVEQGAIIATVIFEPTVKRMAILISSLIQQTGSGDYALWAPLSAMDHTIRDLEWSKVPPEAAQQFAALAATVLHRYADRMTAYLTRLEQYATDPAAPFPTLDPWTEHDTIACYDAAIPAAPPAPTAIPVDPPPSEKEPTDASV